MLKIELEFVFVGDFDPETLDTNLIIRPFSEGGAVHIAIPFGPIFGLEELLGIHIRRTPLCVQMLEDLDGLQILVGGVKVLKL